MVDVKAEINEQQARRIQEALAEMLVTHPDRRKKLRDMIRKEIKTVTKNLRSDARQVMAEDPRRAYRVVKSTIYRRILGANVSILSPRKAGTRYQLVRDRKLDKNPNQRGGNRVKRSERTNQLDTYFGRDRAFILRFVNSGTDNRFAGIRGGNLSGSRGSIAARNWFDRMAPWQMDAAAERLGDLIEEVMAEEFNDKVN